MKREQALSFNVNNAGTLELVQREHDGAVMLLAPGPASGKIIPPGDMVQLVNLYCYVKRADISDSFINPRGRCWKFSGDGIRLATDPEPGTREEQPLQYWFFLCQDGDGGYHILRRALPIDDDSTAAQLEYIERFRDAGGALLAAWPACQVVEIADDDGTGPAPDPARKAPPAP